MAILINATREAAISDAFSANMNNTGILVNGLQTGESVKLQVHDESTNDFVDVLIDGSTPQANEFNNMIAIPNDVFVYRVVKSETINPIAVIIRQNLPKVGVYS